MMARPTSLPTQYAGRVAGGWLAQQAVSYTLVQPGSMNVGADDSTLDRVTC
jgi:hypothetical protein